MFRSHVCGKAPALWQSATVMIVCADGPAERVHGAQGDVVGRGVHGPGARAGRGAEMSLPGCGAGRRHRQDHLP